MRHERERREKQKMRLLREQRLDRGAAALVRDVHHARAGEAAEKLAREVMRAADADRRVIQRPRSCLRILNQLGYGAHRDPCVHHQHQRQRSDHAHRIEIQRRVERRLRRRVRADGERDVAHEQRVAVGGTLDERVGGDIPRGARPVLHHDRLAERFLQLHAQHARDDVRRAAGGEPDQHADRLGRKCLRRRGERNEEQHHDQMDD